MLSRAYFSCTSIRGLQTRWTNKCVRNKMHWSTRITSSEGHQHTSELFNGTYRGQWGLHWVFNSIVESNLPRFNSSRGRNRRLIQGKKVLIHRLAARLSGRTKLGLTSRLLTQSQCIIHVLIQIGSYFPFQKKKSF